MKTLAITALVLFVAIGAAAAWLYMNPAPGIGEPRAVVTLEQPDATQESELPGEDAGYGEFVLPPGVAIIGLDGELGAPQDVPPSPPEAPPPQAETEAAPPAEAPATGWETEAPDFPELDLQSAPGPDPALPAAQQARLGDGPVRLAAAPAAELVENTAYGPLPRIGASGKRPADIYARPAPLDDAGPAARVALLVVGLGLSDATTQAAIEKLPGAISLAFGPYGRNVEDWAAKARLDGHETLLHIPLEPHDYPDTDPGPHTLLTSLPASENLKRLHWLMSRFTGYVGLTNKMGAKFASDKDSLLPLLEEAARRGLIYVDDGTALEAAGGEIARRAPGFRSAHIQVDAAPGEAEIREALARLETLAKEQGAAIGVATAGEITIREISDWSESLAQREIILIPVSATARARHQT